MGTTSEREDLELLRQINSKLSRLLAPVGTPTDAAAPSPQRPQGPVAATGWNPEGRLTILSYLQIRDQGRCGLCGVRMTMRLDNGQLHLVPIVPADTPSFDVVGGVATDGTHYRTATCVDNYQMAHAYCCTRKGGSRHLRQWRHSRLPAVPVAESGDGSPLMLPG